MYGYTYLGALYKSTYARYVCMLQCYFYRTTHKYTNKKNELPLKPNNTLIIYKMHRIKHIYIYRTYCLCVVTRLADVRN